MFPAPAEDEPGGATTEETVDACSPRTAGMTVKRPGRRQSLHTLFPAPAGNEPASCSLSNRSSNVFPAPAGMNRLGRL